MKLIPSFLVLLPLLCGGCNPSKPPSESFVGTGQDGWPYRYRISRTDGKWSGKVDFKGSGGWVHLDRMHIMDQKADEISFRALAGEPGKATEVGWRLALSDTSSQRFSGRLTGDSYNCIEAPLQFRRVDVEPDGPPEPADSLGNTNRLSEAAGYGR